MLPLLLATLVLMVNILPMGHLTPVRNVQIRIIGGVMLIPESAGIAQMIPFSMQNSTLVSHVLRANNIRELHQELHQETELA
jgi:hypothetical protein